VADSDSRPRAECGLYPFQYLQSCEVEIHPNRVYLLITCRISVDFSEGNSERAVRYEPDIGGAGSRRHPNCVTLCTLRNMT
jgi:hypothetical protein